MNTDNNTSIGIFIAGLNVSEKSTFERVIAFNSTQGIVTHYCDDIANANLIITNDNSFPTLQQDTTDKVFLVVTKDPSLGNVQISPPLLITQVMKAVENSIKLVNKGVETKASEISPSPTKEAPVAAATNKTKKHALVIDDSAAIRKQLELELRDADITCDFAESGEQALEMIEQKKYDLVFLDIIMPGIDGYETCKTMRSTAEYKKIPIIMLSGKTSPLDEVNGVIAGATCYLTKPVKSDMLQQTLNRVTKWIDNFSEAKKEKTTSL